MAEPATRVALLARPGAACDNLQAALRQAGAEVVAVQDPADGDPAAIAAARPDAVLVALEPAVEDALARYDAALSEPGRLVIYDEVAVAARREGWEAARWARHLAAKLGGHADVLPPGAGADDAPDAAPPRAPAAAPAAPAPPAPEPPQADTFDADSVHLGIEPAHEGALSSAAAGIDFGGFTPEIMAAMGMEPMDVAVPEPAERTEPAPEAALPDAAVDAAPADPSALEWDAPPEMEAPAAPPPAPAPMESPPSTLELAPDLPEAAPAPVQAPAPVRFSAEEMSLVDIDPVVERKAGARPLAEGVTRGGVVVFAGIGGPDAVRQFLGSLPGGFSRPIIVRQRLDGGRHDRLVRQMQRATALPVELAEEGRQLVDGHVYILPDGLTTAPGDGAASFVASGTQAPLLAGFPAADSAVLVLSGSDPAIVPEAMEAAAGGALVVGQSPEDSFDGAAAAALVAAGGEARAAAELAQRLSTRWLSLKD